jgi:hypothetical protein
MGMAGYAAWRPANHPYAASGKGLNGLEIPCIRVVLCAIRGKLQTWLPFGPVQLAGTVAQAH